MIEYCERKGMKICIQEKRPIRNFLLLVRDVDKSRYFEILKNDISLFKSADIKNMLLYN